MNALRPASAITALLLLAACHRTDTVANPPDKKPASATAFYADTFSRKPTVPEMTVLGRKLFFDASLSASGKLACSSCHDPRHAYGPADDAPVHRGGSGLDAFGVRAVPSLRYVQDVPSFAEHFYEEGSTESEDAGPTGGHTWDGRESSAHDQAKLPLLSAAEMATAAARPSSRSSNTACWPRSSAPCTATMCSPATTTPSRVC
ncbi:MAG: cytochrome-c peroxidase [Pseudomonadota bacterium]